MTFNSHENWVRSVIFHPSGKYILSSSDDKSIRVLDIKVISTCLFSSCHLHCFTGSMDSSVPDSGFDNLTRRRGGV
jgi:platelet-activating factor acetylhydrolase IB subunit alpha